MKRLRFLAKASQTSFNIQHAVVRPDIAGTGSASRISTRGRPYSTKFSFAERMSVQATISCLGYH
jgi:hypothetical protein